MGCAFKYYSVLLLLLCGLSAGASEIEGVVKTESGEPMPQVLVRLEKQEWTTWAFTDNQGRFAFEELAAGEYLCYLQQDRGFYTLDPPCGFYEIDLGAGRLEHLPFTVARTTGVSVEFGTPSGNNGSGWLPVHGNHFNISIYGNGLAGASPAVRKMVIQGYWVVPGQGYADVQPCSAMPAGDYVSTGTGVTVSIAADGLVTIEVTNPASPFLSFDGELAQLGFDLGAGGTPLGQALPRNLVFCIEKVTIWSDDEADIAAAGPWVATLRSVKTND